MAVSIVVGGQYGSEGKGKVAHHLARLRSANAVVRVGGPNSGHTAVGADNVPTVLRQLPTGALLPNVRCVLPPGAFIEPHVLLDEVGRVGLARDRLLIDPNAFIVTDDDRTSEANSGIGTRIGSTCSGTGAAVGRRVARRSRDDLASACPALTPYLEDTLGYLRDTLASDDRVVIEGTQGYGLSSLHSPHWPNATSRDTTAAAALAETGLSPMDVDEIVLVIRALPIRVAGDSGPFGSKELDWNIVQRESGAEHAIVEFTSVTGKIRRVARFEPQIVRRAIAANRPTLLVLNHLDYIDARASDEGITDRVERFVERVSQQIERSVDLLGTSPSTLLATRSSSLVTA
jgi:adenylosuccinate synthase